jgi:hypothetical protein
MALAALASRVHSTTPLKQNISILIDRMVPPLPPIDGDEDVPCDTAWGPCLGRNAVNNVN